MTVNHEILNQLGFRTGENLSVRIGADLEDQITCKGVWLTVRSQISELERTEAKATLKSRRYSPDHWLYF
jgi:hypothetical protein